MVDTYLIIEQSSTLHGSVSLTGAKNAVLVIMASLILTRGVSRLMNVPRSDDVLHMIKLLKELGADVFFDEQLHLLEVDTTNLNSYKVKPDIMKKMRASILVMGPLLARFGKAEIALPGGCVLGARPINYHIDNFIKMGVDIEIHGEFLTASAARIHAGKCILEYPSVGATENIMMAAVLTPGVTRIINAALEPEVLDLIDVLKKMGARIDILPTATIEIHGVTTLHPIEHHIIFDRLEVGSLLLATAITGGEIALPQAPAHVLDIFLMKLQEMGHSIEVGPNETGITLKATKNPKAVSFKTAPYPGFPTDLQAPMMALQCLAEGTSVIEETVFENRLVHTRELQKMGAQISVEHNTAVVTGVEKLYGTQVIATDIRASCALVVAGLAAHGTTIMSGIHHWTRGYEALEKKLALLGARIALKTAAEWEIARPTSEISWDQTRV
ncbi:MAG: UDP-N-acetylglucosamine 1-carboxyvinyltransferase [Candidatus Babeliales bacterium]